MKKLEVGVAPAESLLLAAEPPARIAIYQYLAKRPDSAAPVECSSLADLLGAKRRKLDQHGLKGSLGADHYIGAKLRLPQPELVQR